MARASDRITWRGHTFDRMTVAAIEHAEQLGSVLGNRTGLTPIWQGSYNAGGVSASSGTHDGGGAVDTGLAPGLKWEDQEWYWRLAGFAAYHRETFEGPWDEHMHAGLIGGVNEDPTLVRQIQYYRLGQNGLASHASDPSRRPNPIVAFKYPLGLVDLSVVNAEAKLTKGWTVRPSVKHVQRTLNLKMGADLVVDGIFGPNTRRAYKAWELHVNGNGDGLPTTRALTLLGAARFTVRP